jgi:hypothetical protein
VETKTIEDLITGAEQLYGDLTSKKALKRAQLKWAEFLFFEGASVEDLAAATDWGERLAAHRMRRFMRDGRW